MSVLEEYLQAVHNDSPSYRDHLYRIIAKHGSEWYYGKNDPLWKNYLDTLIIDAPLWKTYTEAFIDKIAWMKQVAGMGPEPWHMHPVVFLGGVGPKNSKINITLAMLKKVFTGARTDKDELLSLVAEEINTNAEKYKLDILLRVNHFFAQVREEAGITARTVESFDYSVEGLPEKFRYFREYRDEAALYGRNRSISQRANQIEIANRAYNDVTGNRDLGNGSIDSGDGWKYRGRGFKQLTGRYNYSVFSRDYTTLWEGESDFVSNPDLVSEGANSIRSAVYFWLSNELYNIADQGENDTIIDRVTRIINAHTGNYATRRSHFHDLKINEVFNEAFE